MCVVPCVCLLLSACVCYYVMSACVLWCLCVCCCVFVDVQVIILLPDRINLIFLSATTPNTVEFCNWIGRTKRRKVFIVTHVSLLSYFDSFCFVLFCTVLFFFVFGRFIFVLLCLISFVLWGVEWTLVVVTASPFFPHSSYQFASNICNKTVQNRTKQNESK